MIKASQFIGRIENVYKIKYTGEILYNVLMEDYEKMMVNNIMCETLHPMNGIAQLYKLLIALNPEEQTKMIQELNDMCIKNETFTSKKYISLS